MTQPRGAEDHSVAPDQPIFLDTRGRRRMWLRMTAGVTAGSSVMALAACGVLFADSPSATASFALPIRQAMSPDPLGDTMTSRAGGDRVAPTEPEASPAENATEDATRNGAEALTRNLVGDEFEEAEPVGDELTPRPQSSYLGQVRVTSPFTEDPDGEPEVDEAVLEDAEPDETADSDEEPTAEAEPEDEQGETEEDTEEETEEGTGSDEGADGGESDREHDQHSGADNVEDTEDTEDTGSTEDAEDFGSPEYPGGVEGGEDGTDGATPYDSEGAEEPEDVAGTEGTENAEGSEGSEGSEGAEEAEEAGGTGGAEDTEGTEGTESVKPSVFSFSAEEWFSSVGDRPTTRPHVFEL